MVFSLQKRFFLFLLVPVTMILFITGVASFMYARSYMLDEWKSTAKVRLEKMAREIQVRLDRKREMVDLIPHADSIPDSAVTQTYLAQQLAEQEGVGFVDIEVSGDPSRNEEPRRSRFSMFQRTDDAHTECSET